MRNLLRALVRKVARVFAEEIRDELAALHEQSAERRIRIDIADALQQLGSKGPVRERLVHFFLMNHRWVAMLEERNRRVAAETWSFIDEVGIPLFVLDQFKVIESNSEEILRTEGHILDLGVYRGGSTRALARIFPNNVIHGFDSFEGLPDDWSHTLKGDFGDIAGELPDVPSNVILHKGWFDETLPSWAAENADRQIALMRVDCDIYSSTRIVFGALGGMIGQNTWILFDELIGYHGWRDHELKAFEEFLEDRQLAVEWVAHGLTYTLVRIGNPEQGGPAGGAQ